MSKELVAAIKKVMGGLSGWNKAAGLTFTKVDGDCIVGVNFQKNKHGGSFTVNLGFHYAFVPDCSTLEKLNIKTMENLSFCFHTRLNRIINFDGWWDYRESIEENIFMVTGIMQKANRIFDDLIVRVHVRKNPRSCRRDQRQAITAHGAITRTRHIPVTFRASVLSFKYAARTCNTASAPASTQNFSAPFSRRLNWLCSTYPAALF
jgi:hypothetical protein